MLTLNIIIWQYLMVIKVIRGSSGKKMTFWLVHRVFSSNWPKNESKNNEFRKNDVLTREFFSSSWPKYDSHGCQLSMFSAFLGLENTSKSGHLLIFSTISAFLTFFSKICVFYSDPLASLTLKNNTFLFYLSKDHFGEYLAIFALRCGLLLYLKSIHFLKEIAKHGKQWRFFRLNSC